jgi:hypothetical protein
MDDEFKEVFKILAGVLAIAVVIIFFMIMGTTNNGISFSVKPRMLKVYDESGKMIFQQQIPDGVKIKSVVVE